MNIKRFRRLMKRSWFRKRIVKLSLIWAILTVAVSFTLAILPGGKADAQAENEVIYYKYYDNVTIKEGDTLWAYALEFKSPDGMSCDEYIKDVKRINHLDGDKLIADQTIVLPYYSTEYICSK